MSSPSRSGIFEQSADRRLEQFTESISVDQRLYARIGEKHHVVDTDRVPRFDIVQLAPVGYHRGLHAASACALAWGRGEVSTKRVVRPARRSRVGDKIA